MTPTETILVPIAFSPACRWVVRYATAFAGRLGASLTFIHVCEQKEQPNLELFVQEQIGCELSHQTAILTGDPAECIVNYARLHRSDLIVMPTHSWGKFRRYLLGSVTAKVLHDARCPVLTWVHHQDAIFDEREQFRSIVCGLDIDPGCVSVAGTAFDIARQLNSRIRFVHAIPAADEQSDSATEVEIRRFLFRQDKQVFDNYFAAQSHKPEVDLYGGQIEQVLREAALTEHAELIIIGRGHSNRTLGQLRTHTFSIIRNAPCPVLSI